MKAQHYYNLAIGKILGSQYRVVEFLGNGWEGEVYKVEEITTGIVRAAKLFYKNKAPAKFMFPHIDYAKRLYLLRDCPVVIQYHHQGSVRIRGQKVDFLVSDFADGEPLYDYIKNQPRKRLLPFEALHLFYALVQGIEQIHFAGEYHGDIHMNNIIVRKKGLNFEVFLIDLMNLGRPNKMRIQQDVYDLCSLLYEIIGGQKYYSSMPTPIKKIILGKKHTLISKNFRMAGHLRLFMENIEWD